MEVNVNLAATYFGGQPQMGQIKFQKLLATALIFNSYYNEQTDKTPKKKQKQWEMGHCLIMLPKSKKFSGTQIIAAKSQYPQHKCNTCTHHEGVHLLPMFPRSLSVCGMLWLSPCLHHKQSFNTRLISAKKWQRMVCQWGSISHDIPEISVTTILSFKSSLSSLKDI